MSIIKRVVNLKTFQIVSSIALVFALVFHGVKTAQAQPTAEIVGTLGIPVGDGANIVIEGDLALISDEQIGETGGGFFIVDIGVPSDPVLVSQTELAEDPEKGIATDIAVRGNLAFMPVYNAESNSDVNVDGLAVFDISNSVEPDFKSNVEFKTTVISDVAVSAPGINLFYSSNPDREELSIGLFNTLGMASLVTTLDIPGGASCVAVTSTGLGVVVGDIGANPQISTLSIVDPVTQTILGSVDFTDDLIELGIDDFDPFGVVVTEDDQFAYVSGGFISDNIVVIDISDTAAPTFVAAVDLSDDPFTGGSPFGISLTGNLLFAANALAGVFPESLLSIVDVSDPAVPVVAAEIDPEGILVDVASKEHGDDILAVTVNADFPFPPFETPGGITVIEVDVTP